VIIIAIEKVNDDNTSIAVGILFFFMSVIKK